MELSTEQPVAKLPEWLTRTYVLKLSGEELLRLWKLSYDYEVSKAGTNNFCIVIERAVPVSVETLDEWANHVTG